MSDYRTELGTLVAQLRRATEGSAMNDTAEDRDLSAWLREAKARLA